MKENTENNKTSVLILMDMPLFPYRIYAYNELAARGYDLTVASVESGVASYPVGQAFCHVTLHKRTVAGMVKCSGLEQLCYDDYDIIILALNMRYVDYYPLLLGRQRKRVIGWGHMKGHTAGNRLAQWLRVRMARRIPALIFYDYQTCEEFAEAGFPKGKLFVANNTQYVEPNTVIRGLPKEYFLYVGRIQKRKGVDLALRAFARLKHETQDGNLVFVIVGGGDKEFLVKEAQAEGIANDVIFTGAIHDQKELGKIFSKAYAYVSPGHVGLGVLHSLACGVPVITCSGRLHSVEITNCKADNSLVVPYTVDNVAEAMQTLYRDKELQSRMSEAAYKYYWENCTINLMVDGVDNAIKHVIESNE